MLKLEIDMRIENCYGPAVLMFKWVIIARKAITISYIHEVMKTNFNMRISAWLYICTIPCKAWQVHVYALHPVCSLLTVKLGIFLSRHQVYQRKANKQ